VGRLSPRDPGIKPGAERSARVAISGGRGLVLRVAELVATRLDTGEGRTR